MRVLVTAVAHPTGISGVQRHAFNLVHCLLQRTEVTEVRLVLAPWQIHLPALAGLHPGERLRIEIAMMQRGAVARNLWHLRELPILARTVQADLVHLSYPVPLRRAAMPCPVVMTLHDFYPFEIPRNFRFPQVLVNRWILRQSLSQADAIASVSRVTLHHLEASGLGKTSIRTVIPNCVEPEPAVSERGPIPSWNGEVFLLAVAQHRRNKNLELLLRSMCRMFASKTLPRTARLVIVGMEGPETPKLHALARQLQIESQVDFLEGLSDPELQWCYRHCAAAISPSVTEGFGLPVAEARLAGARIVCSDIPAFRELATPLMHFVDLRNHPEMALCAAIEHALRQPRPSPDRIRELEQDTIAAQYMELYQTTLMQQAGTTLRLHSTRPFKERQML